MEGMIWNANRETLDVAGVTFQKQCLEAQQRVGMSADVLCLPVLTSRAHAPEQTHLAPRLQLLAGTGPPFNTMGVVDVLYRLSSRMAHGNTCECSNGTSRSFDGLPLLLQSMLQERGGGCAREHVHRQAVHRRRLFRRRGAHAHRVLSLARR